MKQDEKTRIAVGTHFLMLGFNVFWAFFAMDYFDDGTLGLKGMDVSDDPALITLVLFSVCSIAINVIYIKGILVQLKNT